ncbi:hypothetical protein GOBAR_DD16532 [Gossypium barbadense]|nr:hypothetical protein GOBAR_DD16532 [Gossypium barbadense]
MGDKTLAGSGWAELEWWRYGKKLIPTPNVEPKTVACIIMTNCVRDQKRGNCDMGDGLLHNGNAHENRSPDINDMSDTTIDSEPPFEQDMCLD